MALLLPMMLGSQCLGSVRAPSVRILYTSLACPRSSRDDVTFGPLVSKRNTLPELTAKKSWVSKTEKNETAMDQKEEGGGGEGGGEEGRGGEKRGEEEGKGEGRGGDGIVNGTSRRIQK